MRAGPAALALLLVGPAFADDTLSAEEAAMAQACIADATGQDCVGKAAAACADANTLDAPNWWKAVTWCSWSEAALWADAARIDLAGLPRGDCPNDPDNDTMDDPFPLYARDAELAVCALREAATAARGR